MLPTEQALGRLPVLEPDRCFLLVHLLDAAASAGPSLNEMSTEPLLQ